MPQTVLNYIHRYSSISTNSASWLAQHIKCKQLRKGALLLLQTDDIIFLADGLLKKVREADGVVTHFVCAEDFIIYPPREDGHTFEAIQPCSLRYLHRDELQWMLTEDRGMREAYDRLLRHWARRRLQAAELLRLPAPARKELFYENFKGVAQQIASKDIASYLDISVSYFSQL